MASHRWINASRRNVSRRNMNQSTANKRNTSRRNVNRSSRDYDATDRRMIGSKLSEHVKKNIAKQHRSCNNKKKRRQNFKQNKMSKNDDARISRNKSVVKKRNSFVKRLLRKNESRIYNGKFKLERHERPKKQDNGKHNDNFLNGRKDLKL
jgi:hypothetical protein